MYLVCLIEYFGAHTIGWQHQPGQGEAIETHLTQAIIKFSGHRPKRIDCAGRTDKGVHAVGQVIGFETPVSRSQDKWITGINHYLPSFIRLKDLIEMEDSLNFHPRFSAHSRTYRYYLFHNRGSESCFQGLVTPIYRPLAFDFLHQTAKMIEGEHDFRSFQGGGCQAKTTIKVCLQAQWTVFNSLSVFQIQAQSFLQHMVRYLVGCQLQVAMEKHSLQWFQDVLEMKSSQDYCAPPQGLYLTHVQYGAKHHIPWSDQHVWFDPRYHTPKS